MSQDLEQLKSLIATKIADKDENIGRILPINSVKRSGTDPVVTKKESIDLSCKVVDLIQGDSDIYNKYLEGIDVRKLRLALDFILKNPKLGDTQKLDLLTNSWRLYYKAKPPTPEEFLTEQYIGKMSGDLYPRVRQCFLDFMDPYSNYRNAVLYPHIGWGKSTLSVLINLYETIHISLMRNPKQFLGVSIASPLCFVLCSYNLKKAQEVLLEPFINILEGSEYFEKVRTKDDMIKREMEYKKLSEVDHLCWTTASRNGVSAMQFSNNVNYKLASSPTAILGLTIICGTLSELAFFREAGKTDEYIMQFFNDTKQRVRSRMKSKEDVTGLNYFGRTILDSSPNDLESPVDHYCVFDAKKDKLNYIIEGSVWKWIPEDYTTDELKDTFPVFKGSNGKPPLILSSTEGYEADDIIMVPRKHFQAFHDDLIKSIKDLAGIPQGNLDKLFYDYSKIEDCFVPSLKNIEVALKADSRMSPYSLIWDQIKDNLFIKHGNGYHFYYKPTLPRVFHVDQSLTGDMAAVAFCHVERKNKPIGNSLDAVKDLVYVIDFVVPIHHYGGRINLDAIKELITDVYTKGQLSIIQGSFDQFQSEASMQYLERYGLELEHISVDDTMDPYLFLAQLIECGNLKIGRNVYFKNNLKSLRVVPRKETHTLKIDHTGGDIISPSGADIGWDTSIVGINAKDVSDAVCGAVYNAKTYLSLNPMSLIETWDESRIIKTPEMIRGEFDGQLNSMGLSWIANRTN